MCELLTFGLRFIDKPPWPFNFLQCSLIVSPHSCSLHRRCKCLLLDPESVLGDFTTGSMGTWRGQDAVDSGVLHVTQDKTYKVHTCSIIFHGKLVGLWDDSQMIKPLNIYLNILWCIFRLCFCKWHTLSSTRRQHNTSQHLIGLSRN